jgi:hypothetical protein
MFTIAYAPSRPTTCAACLGHAECPHHQRRARAGCGFASRTGSRRKRFDSILFDWSDTANPQVPGYDLQVDTTPNFTNNVLLLQGVARSDYMITPDLLAPGNYFWRVRALHGDVAGPGPLGARSR